ncbi:hypothetical protein WAI453_012123 [Rhynchosporium graminicola]
MTPDGPSFSNDTAFSPTTDRTLTPIQPIQPFVGFSQALQDYQMQLMLLEQQKKERRLDLIAQKVANARME